jgi:polysaccharide pyruvyl transferase WcaK-like protein
MKEKSVLLLGSYGQTNLGDDLLMWNYLDLLSREGFKKIYVNASNEQNIPEVIKQRFPNLRVQLTYQTSLISWAKIIRRVSVVVYGGGTIFKELYSSTGRGKYSVIFRIMAFNIMALLLGAKIYNLNIGIGVLKTSLGRLITLLALKASAHTFLRDSESYLFAKNRLNMNPKKISLSTDGLFLNDLWLKPWHDYDLGVSPHGYKKVVGVNLLSDIPDWVNRKNYIQAARKFIGKLLADGNLVFLIPFQHDFNPNSDYAFMDRELGDLVEAHENLVQVKSVQIDQVVSLFKKLDVFVGMRFHSLLLAAVTETPFVGIAYDTKCTRFLKENNYPYSVALEGISEEKINSAYSALLKDVADVPKVLKDITTTQLKEGKECLQNLNF